MTTGYLSYSGNDLEGFTLRAIERARKWGADAASASVQTSGGIRVMVHQGEVEQASREGHQMLTVTAFAGGRRGVASTAALQTEAIDRVVEEAISIARNVAPDDEAGLADREWLAFHGPAPELFAPSELSAPALVATATAMDAAARNEPVPPGVSIRVSEAVAASIDNAGALATSFGFCRSTLSSFQTRWCMVIADDGTAAVQDYEQASARLVTALPTSGGIAAAAVRRASSALGARGLSSMSVPVLFSARMAVSLVGELAGALEGNRQYRRATYLPDALGRQVIADHLDLVEDPFEPFGMASGGYDGEGVAGSRRHLVEAGVARGYLLGTFSARKLGMRSTGNAGGPWNLRLTSNADGGDLPEMLIKLGRGLLVTQFLGGRTDPVTGVWVRAVGGFWVEGGEIAYPVSDVTIGGSMPDMMNAIVALGSDIHRQGAITSGSILIGDMRVGGSL